MAWKILIILNIEIDSHYFSIPFSSVCRVLKNRRRAPVYLFPNWNSSRRIFKVAVKEIQNVSNHCTGNFDFCSCNDLNGWVWRQCSHSQLRFAHTFLPNSIFGWSQCIMVSFIIYCSPSLTIKIVCKRTAMQTSAAAVLSHDKNETQATSGSRTMRPRRTNSKLINHNSRMRSVTLERCFRKKTKTMYNIELGIT